MDKKKVIYIGLLLILTVIVSITYFSYAFFTSKYEQRGKLNIVTGTLDYKIGSADLTNNSITLEANKSKQIEIEITSLNNIDSKYELYYQTTASNIVVGYGSSNDTPTGTILANGKKTVKVVVKNKSNSQATIVFGVEGGFINNSLVLSTGSHITNIIDNVCNYDTGYAWNFPFDPNGDGQGQIQTYSAPCDGNYKLEVWGAQGGNKSNYNVIGGYGGYATGVVHLTSEVLYYIGVGGQGQEGTLTIGGYNGGGPGWGTGGGATHIALDNGLLSSLSSHALDGRILIVAGGGGGAGSSSNAGSGGGYQGNNAGPAGGSGGTQTIGGTHGTALNCWTSGTNGAFAVGGDGSSYGGGGGGGYYGGGAGSNSCAWSDCGSGAGGSGYIASSNLISTADVRKAMYCYGCQEALNTETDSEIFTVSTTGSSTYRDITNCPNGYSSDAISKCAKEGNGYARITYLDE